MAAKFNYTESWSDVNAYWDFGYIFCTFESSCTDNITKTISPSSLQNWQWVYIIMPLITIMIANYVGLM